MAAVRIDCLICNGITIIDRFHYTIVCVTFLLYSLFWRVHCYNVLDGNGGITVPMTKLAVSE